MAVAAVLWTVAIGCMAWVAARHGKKELSEFTPVERLAGFTPAAFREQHVLDGGSLLVEVSAKDGSYALWIPRSSGEIWLADLTLDWKTVVIAPGSEIETAIYHNITRAVVAGRLDAPSEKAAQNLLRLLEDRAKDARG